MSPELKKAILQARKSIKTAKVSAVLAAKSKSKRKPVKGAMPEAAKKFLGKFSVKSFKDLMKVDTSSKKYSYLSTQDIDQVKTLKESVDTCIIVAELIKFTESDGKSRVVTTEEIKNSKYYQEELVPQLKAFGIDSGDDGFEWIPEMVSTSFIDEFNLDRKVSGLFQEIRMPSNPYRFPVLTQGAIARRVGTVTALSPSQVFRTDKTILFEAVKLTNQYELPEELSEDSAPDIVRVIRQELIEGQEKAIEIAILEGDIADTHQHSFSQLADLTPGTALAALPNLADSPERVFDGLRVRALAAGSDATVDAGGNTLSETEMSEARAKMGKYGVDPSQLAWIFGPRGYNQALQLDDVRTLEQYGPQAPVLTGELAKYEGAPVIVSEYLREDTDATGINGSNQGNNTKASVLLVNRKRFMVGLRRGLQIKVENNRTQFDVLDMVSFQRKAFQAVLKADGSNYSEESSVALIFNIG